MRICTGFALGCLLVAAPAAAQTFWAPEYVQSQPGGAFFFEARYTAGSEGAIVGSDGWHGEVLDGEINVAGSASSDCLCPPLSDGCPLAPGETWEVEVASSLIDPDEPGRVAVSVGICEGGGGGTEFVTITPFAPAPTPAVPAWGAVGLALLLPAAGALRTLRRRARA